ncbi:SDR family NAD(P)-dependent oxidoreductase [Mesorhizobium sp. NZP2077]|uniref:SDR family NAD(P)-dependent oxidoreductase n=1 Tax=Mesorhizobium sp. NZP2077 TaxID=2483404 RepID=UPI0015536EE1|nr:SDR family NAD(P)-dependent oxidoreductase [Mesorhizobium sp. NZP2077]QKC86899.1 SDR family oxidoreductase [Mesorhizobium sp. NZP2077]QKD20598.1 SDR family oxidoreductase [Mesorhizobium sp. NZP2077]
MTLETKTVVVTGAAGGMGEAICKRFAAHGYFVVASDTNSDRLNETTLELNRSGQNALAKAGDLRSKAYCEGLIDTAVGLTGRLDALVNNAGIITRGTVLETTDEDWERTFDINLKAVFYTCRRAISYMKENGGGSIVNISSTWGIHPGPSHAAYCTSKAAVATFSKCLGRDHAGDGIRVNAICPGEIDTPMLRSGFVHRGFDPDTAVAELSKSNPLGRLGAPDDIADAVYFLSSDAARFIAGTTLEVAGAKAVY